MLNFKSNELSEINNENTYFMGSLLLLPSKTLYYIIRSCWVYRSFWVHPTRQDGSRVTSQSKQSFPIQCIEISGMIWGVRTAIFTEIRHLVEEFITFLSIFEPQKLGILIARLNKSLSISTSIQWEGISVSKHAQNLHSYRENNSFWKTLW